MKYDTDEMFGIFRNGFEVSTRKNLTLDDEWRACVGCAILQRSKEKQGIPMGDQCQKCFDEYCWDGSTDSTYNKVVSGYRDYGMRFGSRRLAITKEDAEAAEAAENRDGDSIDDGKNGHGNFNIASVFGISNKLQEIKDKFKEIVKKIIKNSYAPGKVQCPSFIYEAEYNTPDRQGFTRKSNCLSESETEWIKERHKITDQNLKWFLNLADMRDLNTDQFIDDLDRSINIGLAFSGGGYRAMLAAAGEISGLDNRTNGTMEYGLPILPAVSYISGLSGGSWFLCTLAYNNWTSVQEIIDTRDDHNPIWNLKYSIADPNSTIQL
ncbi:unnamed protein product [[Candida] boidinii]|uniref:Unnamed protein product n=1 Tax=Candida boidinii TaxID=5477 RepID=A0ACB5TUK8_CANBO|nr:unnamed protein product [[Candida] boidinii]